MKTSHLLTSAILFLTSTASQAATITYGSLQTDNAAGSLYITDTLTGRVYSRQDAFDMTYSQTVAAIAEGSGSIWEGWKIATSTTADEFASAMLYNPTTGTSSSTCGGADVFGVSCGTINGWVDNSFGASWDNNLDSFAFLSTEDTPNGRNTLIGNVHIHNGNVLAMFDDSWTIADLDSAIGPYGVDLMLYNDAGVSAVPVPAAVWLFGSGLFALTGIARRRK